MSILTMLAVISFVLFLLLLAVSLCKTAAIDDVREDTGDYE